MGSKGKARTVKGICATRGDIVSQGGGEVIAVDLLADR